MADLIFANKAVREARQGADFQLKFPAGIDMTKAAVVIMCDSGHTNGNPESDEIARYRSIGGHFLMVADESFARGDMALATIMAYKSCSTQRVCRSTLAAEAAHLADSLEASEWLAVCIEEAMQPELDLKNWQSVVQARQRFFMTDAKSVYDYVNLDGTSLSKDKRMAIEGALLKEGMRQPKTELKWIDGLQNISDILTKDGADMEYFRKFLQDNKVSWTQDPASMQIKERKRAARGRRKEAQSDQKDLKKQERRSATAERLKAADLDKDDSS